MDRWTTWRQYTPHKHSLWGYNKFADLWKAKDVLLMIAIFYSYFHWSDRQPNFFNPSLSDFFFMQHSQSKEQTCHKYMCQSCMHDGSRPSSMSQNYIYCQKLHNFHHVKIKKARLHKLTALILFHIYSTNVYIHRLWHDIPRFFMHLLDKNILLMKHWKCKICLHVHFWLLLCETGRHSNCFSYSTTGWASDCLVGMPMLDW